MEHPWIDITLLMLSANNQHKNPNGPSRFQLVFSLLVGSQVLILTGLYRNFNYANDCSQFARSPSSDSIDRPLHQHRQQQAQRKQHRTCTSFFSVYSVAYLQGEAGKEACETLYGKNKQYRQILERQSQQMALLNSTLTIFTSWSDHQLKTYPECGGPTEEIPNIRFQQFDPDLLLQNYNFTAQQIGWIRGWDAHAAAKDPKNRKRVPTRLADLWRILLARHHQLAYLDLDMFPVPPAHRVTQGSKAADLYLATPTLAIPVWGDEHGALEVQNSGFCLAPNQLDYLIHKLQTLIESKGDEQTYKMYTELGPNLFQHAVQKLTMLSPTKLLLTSSNVDTNARLVLRRAKSLDSEFYWLHLDGRFRGRHRANGYLEEAFGELLDEYHPKPIDDDGW